MIFKNRNYFPIKSPILRCIILCRHFQSISTELHAMRYENLWNNDRIRSNFLPFLLPAVVKLLSRGKLFSALWMNAKVIFLLLKMELRTASLFQASGLRREKKITLLTPEGKHGHFFFLFSRRKSFKKRNWTVWKTFEERANTFPLKSPMLQHLHNSRKCGKR